VPEKNRLHVAVESALLDLHAEIASRWVIGDRIARCKAAQSHKLTSHALIIMTPKTPSILYMKPSINLARQHGL
jgi:hypothetical protein